MKYLIVGRTAKLIIHKWITNRCWKNILSIWTTCLLWLTRSTLFKHCDPVQILLTEFGNGSDVIFTEISEKNTLKKCSLLLNGASFSQAALYLVKVIEFSLQLSTSWFKLKVNNFFLVLSLWWIQNNETT